MPDSDYTGFVDAEDGFDGGDGQVGVVGDGSNAMEQFDNREVFMASDSMGRPAAGVGSREEGTAGKYGASGSDHRQALECGGTGLPPHASSSHHSDQADCSASFNFIVCMCLKSPSAACAFLTHGPDTSCLFSVCLCVCRICGSCLCLPPVFQSVCLSARLPASGLLPALCHVLYVFCPCVCLCCLCVHFSCVLGLLYVHALGAMDWRSDGNDDSFKSN